MKVSESSAAKHRAKVIQNMPKLARGTLLRPPSKRFRVEASQSRPVKQFAFSGDECWENKKDAFTRVSMTREAQVVPMMVKGTWQTKQQPSFSGVIPAAHMGKKVQFQNLLLNCSSSAQNKVFHRLGDHFRKFDRSSAPSGEMGYAQFGQKPSISQKKRVFGETNQSNGFNITFSKSKSSHQAARTEASSRESTPGFSINCFKNTKSKSVALPSPGRAKDNFMSSKKVLPEENPFTRHLQQNTSKPKSRSTNQRNKQVFPMMQELGLFSTDPDRKPQKPIRPIQSEFDIQNKKMYYNGNYYYSRMGDDVSRDSNDETQRLNQSLDNVFRNEDLFKPVRRFHSPAMGSVDGLDEPFSPPNRKPFKITSLIKNFGMAVPPDCSNTVNYYSDRGEPEETAFSKYDERSSQKLTDTGITWAAKK